MRVVHLMKILFTYVYLGDLQPTIFTFQFVRFPFAFSQSINHNYPLPPQSTTAACLYWPSVTYSPVAFEPAKPFLSIFPVAVAVSSPKLVLTPSGNTFRWVRNDWAICGGSSLVIVDRAFVVPDCPWRVASCQLGGFTRRLGRG